MPQLPKIYCFFYGVFTVYFIWVKITFRVKSKSLYFVSGYSVPNMFLVFFLIFKNNNFVQKIIIWQPAAPYGQNVQRLPSFLLRFPVYLIFTTATKTVKKNEYRNPIKSNKFNEVEWLLPFLRWCHEIFHFITAELFHGVEI